MKDSYKLYYLDIPTKEEGVCQKLILIENGGSYGFVSCPGHGEEYWCADKEQIEEIKKDISRKNVQPIVISNGKEKSLTDKIISSVNSNKEVVFLGKENQSLSQLLKLFSL